MFHANSQTRTVAGRTRVGMLPLTGALLVLMLLHATGQVLYDPAHRTLPDQQGWFFGRLGNAKETLLADVVVVDTTESLSTQAGYSRAAPEPLNRTNGFILRFVAQLRRGGQANTNRAGFSVILLDNENHGIELAFWTDRIFAQTDTPLFTHGEEVVRSTTNSLVEYALSLFETNYVLNADGHAILTGAIRDYSAFNGLINPYRTPNFIFLGDNTTSASAEVSIGGIVLLTPPLLRMATPKVVVWNSIAGASYDLQSSPDLRTWIHAVTLTASTNSLSYTNEATAGASYLRLAIQ